MSLTFKPIMLMMENEDNTQQEGHTHINLGTSRHNFYSSTMYNTERDID